MSVNRLKPYVYVLPEDDANRELANGFHLHPSLLNSRQIQVLPIAGGWANVRDKFVKGYTKEMAKYKHAHAILLVDFDEHADRGDVIKAAIPDELSDRVFVIGAWSNPEALKQANLGTFEEIGWKLAEDCRSGSNQTWGHELLMHNAEELGRMTLTLKPFLFPG